MGWHAQIESVLKRYLSEPAADVALTLMSAFYTAERIGAGKIDEESKGGVIRMLVGLTYGLNSNGWWRQHGGSVWPVFQTAVNAWLDACQYMTEGKPSEAKAAMTRGVVMEVASAVLLADKRISDARAVSRNLRDELAAVKMD